MASRFEKFSERARRVLTIAQEEARNLNHSYIGTEHILLGLAREEEGVAAKVLTNLGAGLGKVRSAVEFIIGRGEKPGAGETGLTPRAKKVIELAIDEARNLGHNYIGTEHLLLGLLREGEGVAASVMDSFGITIERARTETTHVLSQGTSRSKLARSTSRTPALDQLGIDLTAAKGTPIYATADGTVVQAGYREGGFGKKVLIDHGYGYSTLYGHCDEILVQPGQKVSRGEVIARVGSTGLSKSPHLHYEVHVNGRPVDPINYYATDLSPREYDHMIDMLSNADPSFDIN